MPNISRKSVANANCKPLTLLSSSFSQWNYLYNYFSLIVIVVSAILLVYKRVIQLQGLVFWHCGEFKTVTPWVLLAHVFLFCLFYSFKVSSDSSWLTGMVEWILLFAVGLKPLFRRHMRRCGRKRVDKSAGTIYLRWHELRSSYYAAGLYGNWTIRCG